MDWTRVTEQSSTAEQSTKQNRTKITLMEKLLPRKFETVKTYKKKADQNFNAIEVTLANVPEIEQLGCEVRYASSTNMLYPEGALCKVVTPDGKQARPGEILIPLGGNKFDVKPKDEFLAENEEV